MVIRGDISLALADWIRKEVIWCFTGKQKNYNRVKVSKLFKLMLKYNGKRFESGSSLQYIEDTGELIRYNPLGKEEWRISF